MNNDLLLDFPYFKRFIEIRDFYRDKIFQEIDDGYFDMDPINFNFITNPDESLFQTVVVNGKNSIVYNINAENYKKIRGSFGFIGTNLSIKTFEIETFNGVNVKLEFNSFDRITSIEYTNNLQNYLQLASDIKNYGLVENISSYSFSKINFRFSGEEISYFFYIDEEKYYGTRNGNLLKGITTKLLEDKDFEEFQQIVNNNIKYEYLEFVIDKIKTIIS